MAPHVGFAAGTLVHAEGGLRPIETIAVGDRVLAGAGDGAPPSLRTVRDIGVQRTEVVLLRIRKHPGRDELGTLVVGRQQRFRVVAIDAGGGMTMPVGEWQAADTLNHYTLVQGRRDPMLRTNDPNALRVLEAGGLWVEVNDDGVGSELAASPAGAPWPALTEATTRADDYPPRDDADDDFEPEPGEEHLLWWETPARIPAHSLVIDGEHGYYVHAVGVLVRD